MTAEARPTAARRLVVGRGQAARFFAKLIPRFTDDPAFTGAATWQAEVNGEPVLLACIGGALFGVIVPEIADGRITALRVMANADRLGFAARQAVGCHAPPNCTVLYL